MSADSGGYDSSTSVDSEASGARRLQRKKMTPRSPLPLPLPLPPPLPPLVENQQHEQTVKKGRRPKDSLVDTPKSTKTRRAGVASPPARSGDVARGAAGSAGWVALTPPPALRTRSRRGSRTQQCASEPRRGNVGGHEGRRDVEMGVEASDTTRGARVSSSVASPFHQSRRCSTAVGSGGDASGGSVGTKGIQDREGQARRQQQQHEQLLLGGKQSGSTKRRKTLVIGVGAGTGGGVAGRVSVGPRRGTGAIGKR